MKRRFIDSHIHIYEWLTKSNRSYIEGLDDLQKGCQADGICICALTYDFDVVAQNLMAAIYKLHNPTAYAYGAFIYPKVPVKAADMVGMDALTQYHELMQIGFDGLKLFENKPYVEKALACPIDSEFYEPFFAQAEKDKTPTVWHVADPKRNWDEKYREELGAWFCDETFLPHEEFYKRVYAVLERHPFLVATFAHFFFLSEDLKELERIFSKYENVAVDVTPGTEMYAVFNQNKEKIAKFFETNADRLLYGTDCWPDESNTFTLADAVYNVITGVKQAGDIWGVQAEGLTLSEQTQDKILFGNFYRRNGAPKKIDKEALIRYAKKYLPYIQSERAKAEIVKYLHIDLKNE